MVQPGDEAQEPPGLLLEFPDPEHVLDAVLGGLHMAEHHGGRGPHPQPVQGAHDAQPLVGGGLQGGDVLADLVHQDLRSPARHGVHAGGAELLEDVHDLHLEQLGEVGDLGGREGVQGDVGMGPLDGGQELQVPIESQVGVVPPLEQDLGGALGLGFRHLGHHHLGLVDIAFPVPGGAVEGAEFAVGHADIGVVDVAVDEEGGDLRVTAPQAEAVGDLAQFHQ